MRKKPKHDTKTIDFELDAIDEAYETAPIWKNPAMAKLEVETPPELKVGIEHIAKAWILERRSRGVLGTLRRWFLGKTGRP